MSRVVAPHRIANGLAELWSPRVVAEVDDVYVKVAKVKGTLAWHSHDDEDELFYVLKGKLRIEMESGAVELREGRRIRRGQGRASQPSGRRGMSPHAHRAQDDSTHGS